MSWLNTFNGAASNGLGQIANALYPVDPAQGVDPALAKAAQNRAILNLGLGLLAGRNSRQGLGATLFNSVGSSEQGYQQAMDNAFHNTIARHQLDQQNKQEDRLAKQQETQDRQEASQTVNRILTTMKSPQYAQNPGAYWDLVKNQPEVQQALQKLGVSAPYSGPMADPSQLQNFQQQLQTAASVNAAPQAPVKLGPGEGLFLPGPSPTQMTQIAGVPPKSTVSWHDAGDKLIPKDSVTGQDVPGVQPIPKSITPDQAQTKTHFNDPQSSLLAELAVRGVSLPAGLRSKEQQIATLQGLLDKFPTSQPSDIADAIAKGQIDFGAAKKETQIAAGQAGKVSVAVNELNSFGDQVLSASKAIPRGSFIPINRLLQTANTQISDPALLNLKVKMQSLNNAYDQLAARGGTDQSKREHIHQLFNTAMDHGGVEALVRALKDEASAAQQAADKATSTNKYGGSSNQSGISDSDLLKKWGG